jgi:hypothetical protein
MARPTTPINVYGRIFLTSLLLVLYGTRVLQDLCRNSPKLEEVMFLGSAVLV